MSAPRILVAGIGNIFLGDDAFGVEVAQRMLRRGVPANVRVVDFGIRGLDLVYALLDDYDVAILVDASEQGDDPGTLYILEPEVSNIEDDRPQAALLAGHGMNPMRVLETVRAMGGRPKRVLVVGCEPGTLGDEVEGAMGLSPRVEAAVGAAIVIVESLIAQITEEHQALAVA